MSDAGITEEDINFTPEHESTYQVSMVDAVTRYDDMYTGKSYILKVRHALSVPTMDHNVSRHM